MRSVKNTPQHCEKGGDRCGTPTGWRRGGRCRRCRTAHNADLRKNRGLTHTQRAHVLRLLRAGQTPDQAAASADTTAAILARSSTCDGELRAALDGYPTSTQKAARLGDYLAALTRTEGDIQLAVQISAVGTRDALSGYRKASPLFAAAEQAIMTWIEHETGRTNSATPDDLLDYAAQLLEADPKPTLRSVARAIGVAQMTLRNAARRHERLAAALPPKKPYSRSDKRGQFTDEMDEQLRSLWPDKNHHIDDIADLLGVTRAAVAGRVLHLRLPRRNRRRSDRLPQQTPSTQPEVAE